MNKQLFQDLKRMQENGVIVEWIQDGCQKSQWFLLERKARQFARSLGCDYLIRK